MTLFSLKGKKILILGAAGLLGSEFARACARSGANVIVADINAEKGKKIAKEIGGTFEHVDISNPGSMRSLSKKIGRVDGIVNATYPRTKKYGAPFLKADVHDMLADLSLHIGGTLSLVQAFTPQIKKGGSIVLLGSIYGIAAPRFEIYAGTNKTTPAEYAAIKGGTIALTRYFASLLGRRGIRVNAISPGGIADGQAKKFVKAYSKHLKLGNGLLSPADISGALIYLLSDASKNMTGQNLVIDGGWTL